jgi:hypothetical protein
MAKGTPKRAGGKAPVVGYGEKGNAFHNVAKYNQSESGQRHAKNPALSKTPVGKGAEGNVFFSKAAYRKSQAGQLAGAGGPAHQPLGAGDAGHTTPMPGHPSGNPTHVHGPATIGKINGPAPRGGIGGMK